MSGATWTYLYGSEEGTALSVEAAGFRKAGSASVPVNSFDQSQRISTPTDNVIYLGKRKTKHILLPRTHGDRGYNSLFLVVLFPRMAAEQTRALH